MSVVFITGGTGAIGQALIEEFSKTDDVVFSYNSAESKALELAQKFHAEAVRMDVTDFNSVKSGVNQIIQKFGKIDILVNNAGIAQIKPFLDINEEDWLKIIDCDLNGCFRVSRAVADSMVSRKSGAIVNISSVWGVHGASCEVAYSTAKAGVIGFTKALAKELAPSGITVNAVAPGVIDSPMNTSRLSEEEISQLCEDTPLGRMGTGDEVARAVRALAENRFITGQVLGVDGGFY